MRNKFLALTVAIAAASMTSYGQTPAADHLVISEVGMGMPSGTEFTEIYNPTGADIDLTDYFLSDYHLYFNLPSIAADQIDNNMSVGSDHTRQFPPGTIIPSGGVVVVCWNGTDFINKLFDGDVNNFLNIAGSPQLFESFDSSPSYDNMGPNYNPASETYPYTPTGVTIDEAAATNWSHTDGGESEVLFKWDGNSSLVQDVDMMEYLPKTSSWGTSTNQITDKSSTPEIGPSGILEEYAPDNGGPENLTLVYPDGWLATGIRRSLLEVGEVQEGGNGLNGHDESLEEINLTFKMEHGHMTNHTAGVTGLGLSSENQRPVVGKATRNIQNPTPGDTVHITVPVYDDGAFTARLMVDKTGNGYVATTMTDEGNNIYGADISTNGLAEGTHVYWYVEVTDSGNLVATEEDYKELQLKDFFPDYHSFIVKTTPYESTDLVVSEVMYDPHGGNNYHHAQYVEVYNPAATPLDVGGFVFTTDFTDADIDYPSVVRIPKGTVIPAHGFLVITGKAASFLRVYPGINRSRIVDFDITLAGESFMAHAGSTLRFFDPNAFDFDENPVPDSAAFKAFSYTNDAPWPIGKPQGTGAGNTGFPIELTTLTPGADNDGTNWAISTVYNGTPLAVNSTDPVLRSGDVTVATSVRDIVNPTTADIITISAPVTSSVGIATVELMVDIGDGSGFVATPMVSTDGTTYTAEIGPFADKTLVKHYVVATDTEGNKGAFPYTGPVTIVPFVVEDVPALNDVVINEIMYDPYGGDNSNFPEYVELYNRSESAIDLSFYYFGLNLDINATTGRTFPEGTVIGPHSYLIITPTAFLLVSNYYSNVYEPDSYFRSRSGLINPHQVIDLGFSPGSKISNGDGTFISMAKPNTVDFYGGTETVPFIQVNYHLGDGWPANGATLNGPSIELTEPNFNPTDPASWNVATLFNGTPGFRNTMTTPPSQVSDWTLY